MMGGYGMMGWGGGWAPWLWILVMVIQWLLPVALIGLVIYWLAGRTAGRGPSKQDPIDILKERYARGEITGEDFRRMKEDLQR